MSFWLIGISFVSILFSSELTAKLSLKTPVKQIDTIEELANSNLKLVIPKGFVAFQNLEARNKQLFDKIYNKALNDKTIIFFREFFEEKWIEGVSNQQNALFAFEVPIKIIISKASKKLKEKCRFRYLPEDYGLLSSLTIASSMRLNKKFRDELNLKLEKLSN